MRTLKVTQCTPKKYTPSKVLQNFADKNSLVIKEYWFEGENGHWLYLNEGYTFEGCTAVHEYTVKDTLQAFKSVQKI